MPASEPADGQTPEAAIEQAPDTSVEDAQPRHLHAVSEPDTTAGPDADDPIDPDGEVADEQEPGRVRAALVWTRTAFAPQCGLYTDAPPSIAEIRARGRLGGQVAELGPLRTLSIGYSHFAVGNKIAMRTWEWVVDHPARIGTVALLVTLALVFPTTRHLLGYLLTPVVWAQQALLD